MRRYFFHAYGPDRDMPDQEGLELGNDEAARRIALQTIRDMMGKESRPQDWSEWRIEIVDETGRRIAIITSGDALY